VFRSCGLFSSHSHALLQPLKCFWDSPAEMTYHGISTQWVELHCNDSLPQQPHHSLKYICFLVLTSEMKLQLSQARFGFLLKRRLQGSALSSTQKRVVGSLTAIMHSSQKPHCLFLYSHGYHNSTLDCMSSICLFPLKGD
jgi:hypothetical protein